MSENPLAGTWTLTSATSVQMGRVANPYGTHPKGMLVYGDDGAMVAVLFNGDLEPLSSSSIAGASLGEAAHTYRRILAYYGTYEVDEEEGTVTHRLEGCSFPNWVGDRQTRRFEVEGDKLTMATPPIAVAGDEYAEFTLIWQRTG